MRQLASLGEPEEHNSPTRVVNLHSKGHLSPACGIEWLHCLRNILRRRAKRREGLRRSPVSTVHHTVVGKNCLDQPNKPVMSRWSYDECGVSSIKMVV